MPGPQQQQGQKPQGPPIGVSNISKQTVQLPFAAGLDTKTDPKQIAAGKFAALENTIFTTGGLLQKRNGFSLLTQLPNYNMDKITTYGGSLVSISNSEVRTYSTGSEDWIENGSFNPVTVSSESILRVNGANISNCDVAYAQNTYCVVGCGPGPTSTEYYWQIFDEATGEALTSLNTVTGSLPRIFVLGGYYIITYYSSTTFYYLPITIATLSAGSATSVATSTTTWPSTVPSVTSQSIKYYSVTEVYDDGINIAWEEAVANSVNIAVSGSGFGGVVSTSMAVVLEAVGLTQTNGAEIVDESSTAAFLIASGGTATDLTTTAAVYISGGSNPAHDGCVANGILYMVVALSSGSIAVYYLTESLTLSSATTITSADANVVSICADTTASTPVIWVSWSHYVGGASGTNVVVAAAYGQYLGTALLSQTTVQNRSVAAPTCGLVSIAMNGVLQIFAQTCAFYNCPFGTNGYYGAAPAPQTVRSDYVWTNTLTLGGTAGTLAYVARSCGLGSKPVYSPYMREVYLLLNYGSLLQPGYFLTQSNGLIVAKLGYNESSSYSTNNGYSLTQPHLYAEGNTLYGGYMAAAQVGSFSYAPGAPFPSGLYTVCGVNQATFSFSNQSTQAIEAAGDLHINGGYLTMYDGTNLVEHGFFVYPEAVLVGYGTTNGTALISQQYYYYATYEWMDAQGNLHRSAPSLPGSWAPGDVTSSPDIIVPTLRLTTKENVSICIYRWSAANPIPYLLTTVANNTAVDSILFTDSIPDGDINGNVILYTWGGTVPDISAPSVSVMGLYRARLMLVSAEDPNTIWYSKQIIEDTPIEMSDLFTIYVPPTIGTQTSTGPITALFAMDDKLIIFKEDAIYFIVGDGPDNTGANDDFSDPIYVTSTIGCSNVDSIVLTPAGILFQSDKGIWMLGRDLQTLYVGAPVEAYNSYTVTAARTIPGTNQVRFLLSNGVTLTYDYYYQQWATFNGIAGNQGTYALVYNNLDTYINSSGQIYQEDAGSYLDGSTPVLMAFTTAWFHLTGLQGYQRAYYFYLLGQYLSPHTLNLGIAYDYDTNIKQQVQLTPNPPLPNQVPVSVNQLMPGLQNPTYGNDGNYGGSPVYGAYSQVEQFRVFLERQKCQAFQLSVQEIYDPTQGVPPGAGLTLSGLAVVVGAKSGQYPRIPSNQYGG